jgi:hypothetical protein
MKTFKIKILTIALAVSFELIFNNSNVFSQAIKLPELSLYNKKENAQDNILIQRPTKKIYFTGGGKIGMFFLQGDYTGNQMISIEPYGKYVGDNFFAEIAVPIRFKTSPAFTDIGLDINVLYPFLGQKNKTEFDPYVGGGMGLHFIGKDDSGPNKPKITARGGLGLNIIAGTIFFKNYDFNVVMELKYFIYLREFGNLTYQGFGLNIGATLPH